MSDLVVLEDVVVEVDPMLRLGDGLEPVFVGVGAVLEQREPVSHAQRRVAGSCQDPIQTSVTRRRVFRDGEVFTLYFLML
jgi:hypothetical protein